MEKITANMESVDLMKFKLDIAIHDVMFQWNQLEEQLDSNNRFYKEWLKEFELKKKELISIQESVIEQTKKLMLTGDSVGELLKVFDEKTRQANERFNELARKEEQLGSFEKSTERREKEVAAREEIVEATIAEIEADGSQFGNESEQITLDVARFREKRHKEIDAEEKIRAWYRFHSSTFKRLKAEEKELTDRAVKLEPMGNQIDVKVEVKTEVVKHEMDINDDIKAVEIKTDPP